jgi:thiol:disulfide interchange protein DsbD
MNTLLVLVFCLLPFAASALESRAVTTARDTATLVSEADSVAAGKPLRIALRLVMQPGWHTYWANPGDAGAPPSLDVPGIRTSPIAYPTPEKLVEGPFTSYAYTGEVLLPVTLTSPKPGTLAAHATWLICAKICVPEEAAFSIDLPAGSGAPGQQAALFAAADAHSPRPSPFAAHVAPDGTLWLAGMTLPVSKAYFFPDTAGLIDQDAPQTPATTGGQLILPLKRLASFKPASPLSGVLTLTDRGGETTSLRIEATPAPLPSGGSTQAPAMGLAEALLLAFAGGLILNLMPCVLPILAMKAASLSRLSGAERPQVRREAAAYTLGVLAAFSALGGITLAVRAAGGEAGWGTQFQSAAFTTAMAWLLFGIGLNMSGVFQAGASLAGTGHSLAARGHLGGSFFTGLLAVVVATPCTAPFMGAALAASLTLPALSGMAIFLALGAGLAAPYAIFALAPGLARLLPRPGAWMDLFRSLLAFPMYGAALWMVWVVSQQAGPAGLLVVFAGFLLLGFAAWGFGYVQAHAGPRPLGFAAAAAAGASLLLLASLALSPATATAARAATDGSEPFTPARLASLLAEHRPVFIDMSAAWCVTCLVNERVALAPKAVHDAFAAHHVAYLKGDWTRRDPAITAFLRDHDRSGVPLYVYYRADGTSQVLPQILTEATVEAAIS